MGKKLITSILPLPMLMITASHQTFSEHFWRFSGQPQFDDTLAIHYQWKSHYIYKRKSNVQTNFKPYHKICSTI